MKKDFFEKLSAINVNDYTEEREGLTYLTWSWAWAKLKEVYPEATYEIKKQDNGLPYVFDEKTGYMVFTEVTIEGITHEMWLPVMDSKNKAMKDKPYEYTTKYGKKSVEAATMFDINKTIMRCLVKNLAMFGLGLYIYSGEDLPEEEKKNPKATPYQVELLNKIYQGDNMKKLLEENGIEKVEDMPLDKASEIIKKINEKLNEKRKEEK